EPPAIWNEKLASALQESRVFIAIYSPFYFQKKFCGKVWATFASRVEAYAENLPEGSEFPSLMFPVLWQSEDKVSPRIPTALNKIQYKYDAYGKAYAEQGLRVMMRNRKFRRQYEEFVNILADNIIKAAKEHTLPALPNLPPQDQVIQSFPAPTIIVAGANPGYVKLIFLAGSKQEMVGIKSSLEPYGESGSNWRPWLPDPRDEAGLLVEDVIQRETLNQEGAIPLDNELGNRLDEAENSNKIVVILVDLFTLQNDIYRNLMRKYVDPRKVGNYVIIVPWNPRDVQAINQ